MHWSTHNHRIFVREQFSLANSPHRPAISLHGVLGGASSPHTLTHTSQGPDRYHSVTRWGLREVHVDTQVRGWLCQERSRFCAWWSGIVSICLLEQRTGLPSASALRDIGSTPAVVAVKSLHATGFRLARYRIAVVLVWLHHCRSPGWDKHGRIEFDASIRHYSAPFPGSMLKLSGVYSKCHLLRRSRDFPRMDSVGLQRGFIAL